MKQIKVVSSSYIKKSAVQTGPNVLMEKVAGLFFRSVDFDSESIQTLKEYQGKGKVVYISYQSSNAPLRILVNLLRKSGCMPPDLALDFTPGFLQRMASLFQGAAELFGRLTGRMKIESISDFDYIIDLLRDDRPLMLSLLSRRQFIKTYIDIQYDTLQYIVEAQKQIDQPIFLFPQILFWNQNPERTRGLITSRATGNRGFFSGLFTVLKSTTPSFVHIARPLNLKEEMERLDADDSRQIARKIRNRLLEVYNQEKRAVLGPLIKSQQEMMEKVLYHKSVLDEIKELVEGERKSETKLRKKAYGYFKEIAADFSIINIKWFNKAVQYMFTKIFDGINYRIEDLKMVREASQRAPIILVPSHKSHMDYLIISSIFYENKIVPPHIVAGSNLSFFPMGPIFRRSGAFFMRRSFKGLNLYPTIFKQYVKTLINEGYSVEFFIEGGRTRTGKLASPKMGILKYLIDAIEEGYNRDMIFIPITIGYDRILEESSYHMELKGKEKEAESTSAFVKSRKLLKRKYGKVYLSFNNPIGFREYRGSLPEGEDLTVSLGYHILRKINEIIMATPFAVASSAMLQSSAKGFTREMLKRRIAALHDYLAFHGVRMSDQLASAANFDEIIEYVLDSYMQDNIVGEPIAGVRGGQPDVLEGLYSLNENERSRINFYKNTIVHYFLPVSYIANAILSREGGEGAGEADVVGDFADMRELFEREFIYSEGIYDTEGAVGKDLAYLEKEGMIVRENGRIAVSPGTREVFVLFARAIQDFLESYLIVCDCVTQVKRKISRKELLYEVRKNGIKLFHLGGVRLTESLSMPNYENAIAWLEKEGCLETIQSGKKQSDVRILDDAKTGEMKERIERYLLPLQKA
ncbi:MAG: hypothetical protein E4G96_01355 [Chrysiogenales bacterium]|nr:MAG: hypothetical protein E4G96_01355 [Chrysiogenales bacterium]